MLFISPTKYFSNTPKFLDSKLLYKFKFYDTIEHTDILDTPFNIQ